ncbi:MAG: aminotransferase class I/II-fold pyridoxal phosphate-dependent enzyme [Candidatus Sericytochromatia bacterium]|nr:aminotransferase class I/II-fold pyridoxal phosphate-dependent enzyme [Candidatus Tanganyikabacteria bacterium]
MIRLSRRLADLPPYLFAGLNRRAAEARRSGADVINLAAGDPDLPPLPHVVAALREAVGDPAQHRYPPYEGTDALLAAGARYYRRRFGVGVDPEREAVVLIGAKEGLAHAAHALLDPGDLALVPDPAYPVYASQVRLCGAQVRSVPLAREDGWMVDFSRVDPTGASVLFLNYPTNPTGATCPPEHLAEAVAFCRDHGLVLVHDLAYAEITFDGHVAPSVLQVPGASEVAIEINSLSKTYRMPGMRVGFAVGNPEVVGAIRTLKSHSDTGQFRAVQAAAVAALDGPQDHLDEDRSVYQRRRDRIVAGLKAAGLDPDVPGGALYVWARVPPGHHAVSYAELALDRAGVLLTPGIGYGRRGWDFVRVALTCDDARLEEALGRLAGLAP